MRSIIIYVVIMGAGYAIDMGLFLVLLNLIGMELVLANISSKGVSAVFSFFAHRAYTFPQADRNAKARQITMYALVVAVNIPLATAILALLVKWIEQPALAKFIADLLCVGISYLQTRYLVFSSRR